MISVRTRSSLIVSGTLPGSVVSIKVSASVLIRLKEVELLSSCRSLWHGDDDDEEEEEDGIPRAREWLGS